jgi:hypothetical protein
MDDKDSGNHGMKLSAFLLLAAGWGIVVAALFLLPSPAPRMSFVLAGIAVQILGLVLAIRSHRILDLERG